MSWEEVIVSSNTWSESSGNGIYVELNYWVDGYTVDNQNQWTEQLGSSNTWVEIG